MNDVKVFIGSSSSSSTVADLIANGLETRVTGLRARIWNEGVFSLNRGVLERLLEIVNQYDFAVMVWGPDDVTESKGESSASPRDNVIFECGLFMGKLGRDRVFIVRDQEAGVKVPSDFAGITVAEYTGSRVNDDREGAMRQACDKIANEISRPRSPQLVGTWRSRYAMLGDLDRREVIDELFVREAPGGIYIDSLASKIEPYSARGRFVNNQIIGEWQHKSGENYVDGTFMLVVSPRANYMYGYCSGRADDNAMTFVTWVLARAGTEEEITRLLARGQEALSTSDHAASDADVWRTDQVEGGIARGGARRPTRLCRDYIATADLVILGFTTMTQRGNPEEIVQILNDYFSKMVEVIFRHQGTVDKFVGDMVMALFGAPLDDAQQREGTFQYGTAVECGR